MFSPKQIPQDPGPDRNAAHVPINYAMADDWSRELRNLKRLMAAAAIAAAKGVVNCRVPRTDANESSLRTTMMPRLQLVMPSSGFDLRTRVAVPTPDRGMRCRKSSPSLKLAAPSYASASALEATRSRSAARKRLDRSELRRFKSSFAA